MGDAGNNNNEIITADIDLKSFQCPITGERFIDPVITIADGHTYERTAIQSWLRDHRTSPLTGEYLPNLQIVPNHALRCGLEELVKRERDRSIRQQNCASQISISIWLMGIGIPQNDSEEIAKQFDGCGFLNLEFLILGDIDRDFLEQISAVKRGFIGQILHHLSIAKEKYLSESNMDREWYAKSFNPLSKLIALESSIYELRSEFKKVQIYSNDLHGNTSQYIGGGGGAGSSNGGSYPSRASFLDGGTSTNSSGGVPDAMQYRPDLPRVVETGPNLGGQGSSNGNNATTDSRSNDAVENELLATTPPPPPPMFGQNVRTVFSDDSYFAGFDVALALSSGFTLQEGNSWAQCPYGPKMIVSDRNCGLSDASSIAYDGSRRPRYTQASGTSGGGSPVSSASIRWRLRVSGNSSWSIGVVPEANILEHDYLHARGRIGLNSSGTLGGVLPSHRMHEKVLDIVADSNAGTVEISADGEVIRSFRFIEPMPVRLAFCGFAGTRIKLFTNS